MLSSKRDHFSHYHQLPSDSEAAQKLVAAEIYQLLEESAAPPSGTRFKTRLTNTGHNASSFQIRAGPRTPILVVPRQKDRFLGQPTVTSSFFLLLSPRPHHLASNLRVTCSPSRRSRRINAPRRSAFFAIAISSGISLLLRSPSHQYQGQIAHSAPHLITSH